MGKENTFAGAGATCFFCKREDIGTDREKWHEAKLDNIQVRKSIKLLDIDEVKLEEKTPFPEFDFTPGKEFIEFQPASDRLERKDLPTSFTLTFDVESNEQFSRLFQKIKKHQSHTRYYHIKLSKKMSKKKLRKLIHELRKHRTVSDIL